MLLSSQTVGVVAGRLLSGGKAVRAGGMAVVVLVVSDAHMALLGRSSSGGPAHNGRRVAGLAAQI